MGIRRNKLVHNAGRKRVLFVVGTLWPGGIERLTTDMSLALQNTEAWKPSVCCVMGKEGLFLEVLEKHGIPVYECKLDSSNRITFPLRFGELLRQVAPDLIHSHVTWSIPWQVLSALLTGIRPIIFTQQNEYQCWESNRWAHLRLIAYYWLCRLFISAYTTVSEQVRKSFAGTVLRPESDFQVVYNPVDINVFKPAPERRQQARAEMGVRPDTYVIGTVASLSAQKGHDYLLEAARQLTGMQEDIHVVLVGDGPLRKHLQEQVRSTNLGQAVTFLGRRSNLHDLYPAFDCFVLPSLWEGFPLVVVEAMACGLPIVATSVGGVPEALDNGRCGMLVPPCDPRALAEAILTVKSNPGKAQSFTENGRERAVKHFSLDVTLRQYVAIYEKSLSR